MEDELEKTPSPKLGDIINAKDIGIKHRCKYTWSHCPICQMGRWVPLYDKKRQIVRLCISCANKEKHKQGKYTYFKGNQAFAWKLGWHKDTLGYIKIWLSPDDFFHSMADSKNYVLGHRLAMAKHLGRNLHSWEIVHHKNGIRDDNRIENLQLISDDKHKQISIACKRIASLENRVALLEAENILLRQQLEVENVRRTI